MPGERRHAGLRIFMIIMGWWSKLDAFICSVNMGISMPVYFQILS